MPVEAQRFNFLRAGRADRDLSTHMDTVPPFFPLNEDDEFFWDEGVRRQSIIARMICAVEKLLAGEFRM